MTKYLTNKEARKLGVLHKNIFKRAKNKFNISGMYLVEFEHGVKVGMSKNVAKRLEAYFEAWSSPVKSIVVYSAANPRRLEAKVIKHYKRKMAAGTQEFILGASLDAVIKFIEQDPCYKK